MSEPFLVLGWAFTWHHHTCGGETVQNPNPPLRYSNDCKTVRELIYDEWAEYAFHIRVQRLDPHYDLVIKGELLRETGKDSVFMDKSSPTAIVNPKEPSVGMDPDSDHSDTKDYFVGVLFWPSAYKTFHTNGSTQKFRFTVGSRSNQGFTTIPPTFGKPMDTIQIFITDVIYKD